MSKISRSTVRKPAFCKQGLCAGLLTGCLLFSLTACSQHPDDPSSTPSSGAPIVTAPTSSPASSSTTLSSTTSSPESNPPTSDSTTAPTTKPPVGGGGWNLTIDEKYKNTVLGQTADMGEEYLRDIVFVGDSRTYGYEYYGVLPDGKSTNQVWVPSNHTFNLASHSYVKVVYKKGNTELTVKEAARVDQPKIMIIELGINNVSYMTEKNFKQVYTQLVNDIKEVSPNTKIILNSIYCISRSYKKQDQINNDRIYRANQWLLDVAYQTGAKYCNTNEVLRDSEGWLPENYQSGDGLHISASTYRIILDYIRTHAYV